MDCTQVLVESDEEGNVSEEDDRRQVASLKLNEDSFPIFLGENKIGRDSSSCSVFISNLALSSQHAVIQGLECGMFLLYDLNSRNKTKLGKMTLTPNVRYQLKSGDVIRFANVSCTFHIERTVRSSSNSSEKDFPCTQVIDCGDSEEVTDDICGSSEKNIMDDKHELVEDPDVKADGMKTPKANVKKPEDHIFKMPAVTPTRIMNDSFGVMNESKDSSCHADSDDEIFDLLTQPSGEPETSDSVAQKNQSPKSPNVGDVAGENASLSEDECGRTDDDDIFSAATEDVNATGKEKDIPLVPKHEEDNDNNASDEEEITDEDDIFSAATEAFTTKCKKKKNHNTRLKNVGMKHSSALNEDEVTDEEDIFSVATEDINEKSGVKNIPGTRNEAAEGKDAWEEYGIADEDDIFSAATEGLPVKCKKGISKSGRTGKVSEESASKDDEVIDEEDIFSAATEALPAKFSKKKSSKANARNIETKGGGDGSEEDEATDEEDIFSAATEALPAKFSKKKSSKANARNIETKGSGDGSEEDEATDEEDIFSAATEALPAKFSKKKSSKANARNIETKGSGDGSEEDEATDEEDIFSAATEALPAKFSKKKSSKANARNIETKGGGDGSEEDETTDEEDIFSAATEAFPVLHHKRASQRNRVNSPEKDVEGKEATDEEDVFSAATEGFPGKSKGSSSRSSNLLDATDGNEDIFSTSTEGIPLSPGSKSKDEVGSSTTKVSDRKRVQKKEICDSDGFVKDLLSISDSEGMGKGEEKSVVCQAVAAKKEPSDSKGSDCGKHPIKVKYVEKEVKRPIKSHEIKSGLEMESDGEETDVEDALDSVTKEEKTQNQSVVKGVAKEISSESGKSKCANSDTHKSHPEAVHVLEDGNSHINDPAASFEVISDTDDENEEESCINSTVENSKENEPVKSSATEGNYSGSNKPIDMPQNSLSVSKVMAEKNSNQKDVNVNKTMMMTIDETLPTVNIIVVKKGMKSSKSSTVHATASGNESQKITMSDVHDDLSAKSTLKKVMQDSSDKILGSNLILSAQNEPSIIAEEDEEVFVAETPVCNKKTNKGNGIQVVWNKDVEEEEDMSSFLTEVPPGFNTPLSGLKKDVSGVQNLSDFDIQPTPKSAVPCILEKKGRMEYDCEGDKSSPTQSPKKPMPPVSGEVLTPSRGKDESDVEDMSSFLTEAPPEFKTPLAGVRKLIAEEEDVSDLATQPAPKCIEEKKECEEEDMSSFLTEAPPEFKTPVAGVRKLIAEEEEDISDLATQPAPKDAEKDGESEEDMSSFLTEAPPEFKTPVVGVKNLISEEEDLSDIATQPAPKFDEVEKEDMSSFLNEAPRVFKTPVASVRTVVVEEEDISDLATQPAPKFDEKENEEEDMSSFLTEAPPEFKTPVIGVKKLISEEEGDLSDIATQPTPKFDEKENEEEDMSSFLTQAPPEFKTPKVGIQNSSMEDEDLSEFATQPTPVDERELKEEMAMNEKPLPSQVVPEFKTPKDQNKCIEKEEEEDLSDLATQPAPSCFEKDGEDRRYKKASQSAPVSQEKRNDVGEIDLFSSKAMLKSKTFGGPERSIGEEDDLSELDTQPAPVSAVSSRSRIGPPTHLTEKKVGIPIKREQESEEEDLSLLDTQPAPSSPISNKLYEDQKKGREKIKCGKKMNSPRKGFPSPKAAGKPVNVFADLETQIEAEESSDSDFDFSMGLPNTPDLLTTLQQSGNKFVPPHASCRNLFNSEKKDESTPVSMLASLKGSSEKNITLSRSSEKRSGNLHKEKKSDVVKDSELTKTGLDVKDAVCPSMKLEERQKEPGHMNSSERESVNDSKGFYETGVTMVKLNSMQTLQKNGSEKSKSKAKSLLREVVVTSTPIHSGGASSEQSGTPGLATSNFDEKTSKPARRGRRKAGGAKGDIENVAKEVSPVVGLASAGKMPSYIKVLGTQSTKVDDAQKGHNLRVKKPSESRVAIKAGSRRRKATELNPPASATDSTQMDEPGIKSLNAKTLRGGKKRNMPPTGESAPLTKARGKSAKGREKIELVEASTICSENLPQPMECPEKPMKSDGSHKRGSTGETSESSNAEGELSPVIFYGKHPKALKSDQSASIRSDSSAVTHLRKKAQDVDAQGDDRNNAVVSQESVRRSDRERKPKKRFSVDCSPAKPKKNKSGVKSLDSIPSSGRVIREKRDFIDTCPLSYSGMNSSLETDMTSDSNANVSRKRASDDDQSLRSNKRSRVSSPAKVVTRGGLRGRAKEDSSPQKVSLGSSAKKNGDRSKLSSESGEGGTIGKGEKEDTLRGQGVPEDDNRDNSRVRGKKIKDPVTTNIPTHVSTRSKGDKETSSTKQAPDESETGKRVILRLKVGSSSDGSLGPRGLEGNSRVNQESLREENVAGVEKSRRGRSEFISSNSLKKDSFTTEEVNESKEEDLKKSASGRTASSRSRRRKMSPEVTDRNSKKDIADVKKGKLPSSSKVAPLRISRSRIVSESEKGSEAVAVGSPVYNQTIVGEYMLEDKLPARVRKQKKDSVNVLFTGLNDLKLNQTVERLGGSIVESPQNCSVLVTDRLRRTYKLLCAIARGIPIVTAQWLTESSSSGRFLDPMAFLVIDRVTEKRFDFTLKTSLEKARVKPMLSGYSFIATPSVKPPPEEVKGIVTCAGGEYISSLKELESRIIPQVYVVSCADDSGVWNEYTKIRTKKAPRSRVVKSKVAKEEVAQAKLVGVEGLLVSVLRQKPDLEHKEFSLC